MNYIDEIILGDAFELIKKLPEDSIDCIITSPPFWKMRNKEQGGAVGFGNSLDQYVESLVNFFDLARRPLKQPGTVWLNLGDKHEDGVLLGIPWRTVFALEGIGYYTLSEIIWNKMNKGLPDGSKIPKGHETIFFLSQVANPYFERDALKEKGDIPAGARGAKGSKERYDTKGVNARPPQYYTYTGMRQKKTVWNVQPQPSKEKHYSTYPIQLIEPCVLSGCPKGGVVLDPFSGASTTAVACVRHNRKFVGFEIDEDYVKISNKRISEERSKLNAA